MILISNNVDLEDSLMEDESIILRPLIHSFPSFFFVDLGKKSKYYTFMPASEFYTIFFINLVKKLPKILKNL